jgi:hypothetical protein
MAKLLTAEHPELGPSLNPSSLGEGIERDSPDGPRRASGRGQITTALPVAPAHVALLLYDRTQGFGPTTRGRSSSEVVPFPRALSAEFVQRVGYVARGRFPM